MKILVLDDFDDFNELEISIKEIDNSIEVICANKTGEIIQDIYNSHISTADILIVGPLNKEILEKASNLKWVHSTSAGVNSLLFPEFIKSSILLTNARGIHPIPITEHVFAAILSFQRRFKEHILNQEKRQWIYNRSDELYGKTLGIIGLGEIGKRIAKIGKAFGCKIIGVKRIVTKGLENVDELYPIEKIDNLLEKSDYIVLCLPSTSKTKNIINKNTINKMKSSAVIINIGRGDAINDEDLIEALKNKKINGAALDVFREEPLPNNHPYYELNNIIITPHHSGSTLVYDQRSIKIFCKNLKAYINNQELPTLVNKQEGY